MTGVENVNLSLRYIPAIGFRLREVERKIILAPDYQQARLLFAHPCLPFRISVDVSAVVVKQVALNVGLDRLTEESKFVCPEIWVIAFHVRIVADMARPRRRQRQEIGTKGAFIWSAIGPKGPPCLPIRCQAFVVRHSVLDDQSLDPV